MDSEVRKRARPILYGLIKAIPKTDATLTKAGYAADAKAVGDILRNEQRAVNFSYDSNGNGLEATTIQEALDELNWAKLGRAYLHSTEITNGDTGYCTFDITPYVEDKCIGIISICGSENKTSLAVVVWGKNYDCGLCDLVLSASSDVTISRSGRPKEILLTPRIVLTPRVSLRYLTALSVSFALCESVLTVIARASKTSSDLSIPYS